MESTSLHPFNPSWNPAAQHRRLAELEQESYDLKSIVLWGGTDSDPPMAVPYAEYELLEMQLQALRETLRRVCSCSMALCCTILLHSLRSCWIE